MATNTEIEKLKGADLLTDQGFDELQQEISDVKFEVEKHQNDSENDKMQNVGTSDSETIPEQLPATQTSLLILLAWIWNEHSKVQKRVEELETTCSHHPDFIRTKCKTVFSHDHTYAKSRSSPMEPGDLTEVVNEITVMNEEQSDADTPATSGAVSSHQPVELHSHGMWESIEDYNKSVELNKPAYEVASPTSKTLTDDRGFPVSTIPVVKGRSRTKSTTSIGRTHKQKRKESANGTEIPESDTKNKRDPQVPAKGKNQSNRKNEPRPRSRRNTAREEEVTGDDRQNSIRHTNNKSNLADDDGFTVVQRKVSQKNNRDGASNDNTRGNLTDAHQGRQGDKKQYKCLLVHDSFMDDFNKAKFSSWFDVSTTKFLTIDRLRSQGSLISKIKHIKPSVLVMHMGYGDILAGDDSESIIDNFKVVIYDILEKTESKLCISQIIPIKDNQNQSRKIDFINETISTFLSELRTQSKFKNRVFTSNNTKIGGFTKSSVGPNGRSTEIDAHGLAILWLNLRECINRSLGIQTNPRIKRNSSARTDVNNG